MSDQVWTDGPVCVLVGDCLARLRELPDASVDAVVTDPPAGISFMGAAWDTFPTRKRKHGTFADGRARPGVYAGQECNPRAKDAFIAWLAEVMAEALRVAKPGALGLVWAIPRTAHWTADALEDAGWEIHPNGFIAHHFASGFPKAKTHLKPATEVWWLVRKPGPGGLHIEACRVGAGGGGGRDGEASANRRYADGAGDFAMLPGPRGGDARGRWPANLVLSHAEGCRPAGTRRVRAAGWSDGDQSPRRESAAYSFRAAGTRHYADADGTEAVQAWECVEGCPVAELDRQSGTTQSGFMAAGTEREGLGYRGGLGSRVRNDTIGDTGGASRFFYVAKASASERSAGVTGFDVIEDISVWVNEDRAAQLRVDTEQSPPKAIAASTTPASAATAWSTWLFGSDTTVPSLMGSKYITVTKISSTTASRTLSWLIGSLTSACTVDANSAPENGGSPAGSAESGIPSLTITFGETASLPGVGPVACGTRLRISIEGAEKQPRRNRHATVKPLELMRWLCRLVTPPGGVVLDPFAGSGTTGCAAVLEGLGFVGIEQDKESARTAKARIEHWRPRYRQLSLEDLLGASSDAT